MILTLAKCTKDLSRAKSAWLAHEVQLVLWLALGLLPHSRMGWRVHGRDNSLTDLQLYKELIWTHLPLEFVDESQSGTYGDHPYQGKSAWIQPRVNFKNGGVPSHSGSIRRNMTKVVSRSLYKQKNSYFWTQVLHETNILSLQELP